jgi:hypothetical protein
LTLKSTKDSKQVIYFPLQNPKDENTHLPLQLSYDTHDAFCECICKKPGNEEFDEPSKKRNLHKKTKISVGKSFRKMKELRGYQILVWRTLSRLIEE